MRTAGVYIASDTKSVASVWSLRKMLGQLLFVTLLLSMINGLMPQAEMAVFAGHVLIPAVILKWVMILIAVVGVLIKAKSGATRHVIYAWVVLGAYLVIEAIFFTLTTSFSSIYILYSFEASLYFLLIVPFMFVFKESVNERHVFILIMWLFVPLVILGIWQDVSNHPVLPTMSIDHYFQVYSWDFYGHVRAFSLFGSASNFGHFLALVAAMCVAALGQWRGTRKSLAALGLAMALIATYMTLTRATYVEVLLAITTATLITFLRWRGRRLSLLWGIYTVIGFFVAFAAPEIIAGLRGADHLFAGASLLIRYEEWAHYGGMWLSHGIDTMLFGTGLMQSSRFAITRHVVIDNVWLSLVFQFGLFGFTIVLAFIWQLWRVLVKGLQSHPQSILTIGVVSACSTFPFTSIFGITTLDYFLLFMVWLISKKA